MLRFCPKGSGGPLRDLGGVCEHRKGHRGEASTPRSLKQFSQISFLTVPPPAGSQTEPWLCAAIFFTFMYLCVFIHARVCTWRAKDNLPELILSFYHVDPRD